jgi:hypothetical protein
MGIATTTNKKLTARIRENRASEYAMAKSVPPRAFVPLSRKQHPRIDEVLALRAIKSVGVP